MPDVQVKSRILGLVLAAVSILVVGAAPIAAAEPPPVNDSFSEGLTISADSGETSGSNLGATKEAGEPAHAGDPGGASVWYRWTAARNGHVVFSSCGSEFDTVLAVYTGSTVSSLTEVTSTADCEANREVSFRATAGTQYHVALDGKGGATGTLNLYFFQRPTNDDRADAHGVEGDTGSVPVSNQYGSLEPGEQEHGGPGGASVWFRWTAPSSGPARFDTCGGGEDTLLGAYEGAATTPLATNDDYCDVGSMIGFSADAGKEYLLVVDGYDGDWIAVNLNWSRAAVPPLNVDRPTIVGTPQEGSTLTASEGSWSGTPPFSFSYEWARCNSEATFCQLVPGANGRSYALGPFDVASRIRVFVTATNGAGANRMNSAATAPVTPRPHAAPINSTPPTIAGTPAEGAMLTAVAGDWAGYPPPTFAFQWQSCAATGDSCVEIPGEIEPTLMLSPGEVGRRIRVVVVASNSAGAATAHSAPTGVVAGPRPQPRAKRCVVPNVRGKTLRAARAAIRRSRCRVGRIRRTFTNRARAGRVLSQSPRPGTRLRQGGKVNLVLSRGRKR